ncbi:putative toxin-antitoxin system toxin component, PIN family [candidate division KSB1 bacterium 4484_188]|nr:MAG: putative toxin-antitoxin system toxin component, PIN family [candidate division KSB1 bacterium 4484_188]
MRVVIDTNVFISSFFGGNPRKIVELWKNGEITLCVNREIIEEYVGVLQRLDFHKEVEIDELLSLFARGFNLLFSTKKYNLKIVENDPEDDKFFECVVSLKAKFIISGDKEVLSIKKYMDIDIVTPVDFLKMFSEMNR